MNPELEPNDNVTIPRSRLDYLQRRDFELSCLESGGVDNWEWYHESLKDGGFFDEENE